MNFLLHQFCFLTPREERFNLLRENFAQKAVGCTFKFKQIINEEENIFSIFRDGIMLGSYSFAHNFNDGYCMVGDENGLFFIDICGDVVLDEQLINNSQELEKLIKAAPKSVAKYVTKDRFEKLNMDYSQEMVELANACNKEIEDIIEANKTSNKENSTQSL